MTDNMIKVAGFIDEKACTHRTLVDVFSVFDFTTTKEKSSDPTYESHYFTEEFDKCFNQGPRVYIRQTIRLLFDRLKSGESKFFVRDRSAALNCSTFEFRGRNEVLYALLRIIEIAIEEDYFKRSESKFLELVTHNDSFRDYMYQLYSFEKLLQVNANMIRTLYFRNIDLNSFDNKNLEKAFVESSKAFSDRALLRRFLLIVFFVDKEIFNSYQNIELNEFFSSLIQRPSHSIESFNNEAGKMFRLFGIDRKTKASI